MPDIEPEDIDVPAPCGLYPDCGLGCEWPRCPEPVGAVGSG